MVYNDPLHLVKQIGLQHFEEGDQIIFLIILHTNYFALKCDNKKVKKF